MRKTYSFDPYFKDLKYMISFYDILIKNSNITKEALFDELNISYMTYSRAKLSASNAGRAVIDKLETYFRINSLDTSKQAEYEKTLNDILYRFYYRGNDIHLFEPILKGYIDENNYLKPIFSILLLLINLVSDKSPAVIIKEKQDVYNSLKKYKGAYLTTPFAEIFTFIEIIFSEKDFIEYSKEIPFSDDMRGILYYAYCSNAYLSKRYDLCLYYAKEGREYLLRDLNFKRVISINLYYFASLNVVGEYLKCAFEAKKQILYLIETKQPYEDIYSTEIHYYTACLGMKDYEEIINCIYNKSDINSSEYMFLLIATSHTSNLYKQVISRYKSETNKFNEKQNRYINMIIDYLSKRNRSQMKEILLNSELNIGLKDILTRFY